MLTTAIHFPGNCDEAISLYKDILGAEVKSIYYFKDAPADHGMEELPPNYVMHSEVEILGQIFNLTDGGESHFTDDNFSFMIVKETADEVAKLYHDLSEGGKIIVELAPAFWASMYGMVMDRFGVCWQMMTPE